MGDLHWSGDAVGPAGHTPVFVEVGVVAEVGGGGGGFEVRGF